MITCKKYLTMLALIALIVSSARATPIDSATAHDIASRFSSKNTTYHRFLSQNATWCLTHVEPSATISDAANFYIFNASDNSAFIIVAGEDRAHSVLAYGDGCLDIGKIPDNMHWMLDHYSEQIEFLHHHPEVKTRAPHRETVSEEDVVPTLLTTKWGQGSPYRNLCPTVDNKPCIAGCVATSMAQVMYYWKFPTVLPALPSYITSTLHLMVDALQEETVEWDLMLDSYQEGMYNDNQSEAVATLIRYCGQACKMDYTIASSKAWNSDQLNGMKKFGYNPDATCLIRDDYDDDQWNALILEDLRAKRPVIYSGQNESNNHNFIIDGYDGSKYHINWGWDGVFNSYFELDAMNGGGFKPSNNQQMLHGVYPVPSGSTQYSFDFVKNGICYNLINNHQVGVCRNPMTTYSGSITVPEKVKSGGEDYTVSAIEDMAFYSCTNLTSINLPHSISHIGNSAFYGSSISSIIIPDSVRTMGVSAFSKCNKLIDVTFNNVMTSISDNSFMGCKSLSNFIIPSCVTHIGKAAFKESGPATVTIPSTMSQIDDEAFMSCPNLKTLIIGRTQLAIGSKAFDNTFLMDITCLSETPPVAPSDCFTINTYQIASLRVPDCAVQLYNDSEPWKQFAHINTSIDNDIESNGILYRKTSEGTLSVRLYTGSDENLIIPQTVVLDDETLTVTAIEDYAFAGNLILKSVVMPNTIIKVGQSAFKRCLKLQSITLSNAITAINDNTFEGCKALTAVDIPRLVTSIGKAAFMNCLLLHTIVLPDTLTSIGDDAFNTTGLASIIIPKNVSHIGSKAFLNNEDLEQLTILCTLDTLYSETFYRCDFLKEVVSKSVIPPSGNRYCFTNTAYSNARLTVPYIALNDYKNTEPWCRFSNVVSSDNAFAEVDGLYFVKTGESTVSISLYTGNQSILSIPSTIVHDGYTYTVTGIESFAFNKCTTLERVEMPNTITAIGNAAFRGCKQLNSITLSNAITVISNSAFEECSHLPTIDIPNSVTGIGEAAFKKCVRLTNIKLPESITTISNSAFEECSQLATIDIPNSVTGIGEAVFKKCVRLTNINLPESITTISNSAFEECSQLPTIDIPNSVTDIGEAAFKKCVRLTNIKLPETITTIGNSAFEECSQLATIDIPNSVTGIGEAAFKRCIALCNIDLPESILTISNDAFYGSGLIEAVIPSKVTHIGQKSFASCNNLSSVTILSVALSIGDNAFNNTQLVDINCYSDTPPMANANCFDSNVYTKAALMVPDKVKALYKNSEPWKNFIRIFSTDLDYIIIDDFCFTQTSEQTVSLSRYSGKDETVIVPESIMHDNATLRVTAVDDIAFCVCDKVKSVTLPNTITTIGRTAFWGCSSLEKVTLGQAITVIEDRAFEGCSSLKHIDIPSSVMRIGDKAFKDCKALTNLTIRSDSLSIGEQCFANLPLNIVVFCMASEPPSTGSNCFGGSQRYATLYVPQTSIDLYKSTSPWSEFFEIRPFVNNCNTLNDGLLYSKTDNGTVAVSFFFGAQDTVSIPETITINDSIYRVTGIQTEAFVNREINSLVIPRSIEYFEPESFLSFFTENLIIQDIDAWCMIDFLGFYSNPTTYCNHVFIGDEEIKDITLSNKVKEIKPLAFSYIKSLESINLSDSVETIGYSAFLSCTNLKRVHLGQSVQSIALEAFCYCSQLESINIPKSLTYIGYQAFFSCPITHVEIEDLAMWCDFNEFWLDDYFPFIPFTKNWHLYHDGQEIVECVIPEGVTRIKPFSFSNCASLKKITMPTSLTTIYNSAFENCSELETIDLPNGLKTIQYRAFNLCPSMKKVISRSTDPPVISNANAFSAATYADVVLYVPSEAIEAYRNAEHWNRFTHIRPLDLHGDVNSDDEITVADINALLDALPTSEVTTRLDINGDGEVNIADVNTLIDMILSGTP